MLRQQIHIKTDKVDWKARIYYIVTGLHAEEIMEQLKGLQISGDKLQEAETNLYFSVQQDTMQTHHAGIRQKYPMSGKQ